MAVAIKKSANLFFWRGRFTLSDVLLTRTAAREFVCLSFITDYAPWREGIEPGIRDQLALKARDIGEQGDEDQKEREQSYDDSCEPGANVIEHAINECAHQLTIVYKL